jgi:hypothetical protein
MPNSEKLTAGWTKRHNQQLYNLNSSPNVIGYIGMMTSRTVIWVGRLVCKRGTTNAHKILFRRLENDRPLDRPRL